MRRPIPYRELAGSLAILLIGTGLAVSGAWLLSRTLIQTAESRFVQQAQSGYTTLNSRLEQEHARLLAARGFYLGSSEVSTEDWQRFATALYAGNGGGRSLLHLAYAPAGGDGSGRARLLAAHGLEMKLIRPLPAAGGEYYCPVDRIWPASLGSRVLGFNPCGNQDHKLFDRAAAGPGLVATGDVPIYSQEGAERGLVFIASAGTPAAAGIHAGWVAETVPSRSLFPGIVPNDNEARVQILDVSGAKPQVLYENSHAPLQAPGIWKRLFTRARIGHFAMNVVASNRHWRMLLSAPISTGWTPLAVASSGFIISLLLAALFYALARTGHHARGLAASMTRELSANRELLTSVSNNVRDGIYRGTPEAGLVYVNRTLARMFGYDDESGIAAKTLSLRYANPARRDELRDKLFREHSYEDEEVEYIRNDGSRFVGLNSAWATRDAEGRVLYYDGVVTDITERKAAAKRIRQMTYYDRLTGLPNQALLEERFHKFADEAGPDRKHLAYMLIDLDNFKNINALHGHEVGDQVIKEAAQRLQACLRLNSGSIAARMGGDEFIILMRESSDVELVTREANRIREALSVPYEIGGHELHTSPSIGIALYPQDGSDLSTLRQHADAAMYQAKQSGRAEIAYFARHLTEQARRQVQIESALHMAIERGEMAVHYQPRANIEGGRICGVEALLRWTHPEWGAISPAEFVPVAERTGQIVTLGNWVLEQALQEWKQWAAESDTPPRVGVNVSARQLHDDNHFADTVAELLLRHDVPGDALEIEITETMLVDHLNKRAETLANIKALGVKIALDDFGTGYSSLSYLSRFSIDVIKVDQSFIRGLTVDPKDVTIVRAVSLISRAVGIELVAEGVETEAQFAELRRLRYQAIQGFLFARPMPADILVAFLRRHREMGPPGFFGAA